MGTSARGMTALLALLFLLLCGTVFALASTSLLQTSASFFVLITLLQTLDHFGGISLDWPPEWQVFFTVMSLFNFNLQLTGVECLHDGDGYLPLLLHFSLPLLAVAVYMVFLLCYALLLLLLRFS